MSVKTRTIVPTLVVVGLIVAGFQLMRGPSNNDHDNKNEGLVIVTGTWEPSPRIDGVQVVVSVAGSLKVDGVHNVAPFSRTYPAKRGDKVSITLTFKSGIKAQDRKDLLACSIKFNGIEESHDYNQRAGISQPLTCTAILT